MNGGQKVFEEHIKTTTEVHRKIGESIFSTKSDIQMQQQRSKEQAAKVGDKIKGILNKLGRQSSGLVAIGQTS